ncbi:hypothetical protein PROFUN_13811 [Planoprotostelium fungivorum]|uniref:Uncharacterized protein n=1 Tax=Planoprotostelium fungivorum TaxID=1890364 RepID=A0A2P6N2Z2_9EUKA|nr:hypothetical protein PROFUN_13811 [Planoprotostelium fungivorum]
MFCVTAISKSFELRDGFMTIVSLAVYEVPMVLRCCSDDRTYDANAIFCAIKSYSLSSRLRQGLDSLVLFSQPYIDKEEL